MAVELKPLIFKNNLGTFGEDEWVAHLPNSSYYYITYLEDSEKWFWKFSSQSGGHYLDTKRECIKECNEHLKQVINQLIK